MRRPRSYATARDSTSGVFHCIASDYSRASLLVLLWGLGALLLALVLLGGCGRPDDSAGAGESGQPQTVANADSTHPAGMPDAATDGTVSDSTAAGEAEEEATEDDRGFFARIFNRDEEKEEEEEAVPVELTGVVVANLPHYLLATATLEPEKQAQILAKITGEIQRIQTEEGHRVGSGQVLALLDGAVQRVTLEEADARLEALRLDLERITSLHDQQLASDKNLHDALSAFAQGEAQRKAAALQVEYTRIVAPFDGQIAERFVDPGQTVAPGGALFSIVDCDPLLATIHLPERQAVRIAPGQGVVITPDTDPDLQVRGEVLRVAPIVDPRTGTVKVTCSVLETARLLRPGSFVRVKVETEVQENVVCIPKRALLPEGEDNYVFKAVADSVLKVPIVTGHHNHTLVEVLEGLTPGERVVTVGHGALKSGSKIREINPQPVTVAHADSGRSADSTP